MKDAQTKARREDFVLDIIGYRIGGCKWLYDFLLLTLNKNKLVAKLFLSETYKRHFFYYYKDIDCI